MPGPLSCLLWHPRPKTFSHLPRLLDGLIYLPRAKATNGMTSGPQGPRTDFRPRCDSRRKRWGHAGPVTCPHLGPRSPALGLESHTVPVARDSKPPVGSRAFPRLVLLLPGLSFSVAPSGGSFWPESCRKERPVGTIHGLGDCGPTSRPRARGAP